jgi:predicted permease
MAVVRDVRNALRQLIGAPGFTFAIILSLAFGIGANAGIFTLLNALLWRPLPVANPGALVQVGPATSFSDQPGAIFTSVLDEMRADSTIAGVCGFNTPLMTIEIHDRVIPVSAVSLAGGCFETLGVRAAIGRLIGPADGQRGTARVAVLSYETWQQEYGDNPNVLGRAIRIEGYPATIIGVTEPHFKGLMLGYPAAIYVSEQQFMAPVPGTLHDHWVLAYLRRRPGVSIEQFRAHLAVLWPRLLESSIPAAFQGAKRDEYLNQKLMFQPASTGVDYFLRKRFGKSLMALFALTALVLLLSCVNVANLLLTRGLQRRHELALRIALGAGRWPLMRGLLAEGLILTTAGLAAGTIVAFAASRLLVHRFQTTSNGFDLSLAPDWRVFAFAAVVSGIVLMFAALWPAWRNTGIDTAATLKEGGRSVTTGRTRTRRILITAQVALTLVLLCGASMFIQMLTGLQSIPLGFEKDHVLNAQLVPVPRGYGDGFNRASYYRSLLENVRSVPGVQGAALTKFAPLFTLPVPVPVQVNGQQSSAIRTEQLIVTTSFFSALNIHVLRGSGFSTAAAQTGRIQAIISESLAERLFGTGNALGQTLYVGAHGEEQQVQVTGIASNARLFGVRSHDEYAVYLNYWQIPDQQQWPVLLVRTAQSPAGMIDSVARTVRALGHEYPLYIRTLQLQWEMSFMQERLLAGLGSAFGIVALIIAAVGLYGLLTYYVSGRTVEIGTRLALGAQPRNVRWLVVREALFLLSVGAGIGTFIAIALERAAPALVPEWHVAIAVPLVCAVLCLLIAGIGAAWIPAWRASNVDPLTALRHE